MPLFYIIGLAMAGVFISAIGAWFSVSGLAALFNGAALAVGLMAGGLEFAKLIIAAFLHRAWKRVNFLMKVYMVFAVIVLSVVTSAGIFGFLSNAFQKSSMDLTSQMIKISAHEEEIARADKEIKQIEALIDQVPPDRITRKIALQREMNPRLDELKKKRDEASSSIRNLQLTTLETNTKVGPLVFISKAFKTPIESVAKWVILVFVLVFDPLAICLIIATSASIKWREEERKNGTAPASGGGIAGFFGMGGSPAAPAPAPMAAAPADIVIPMVAAVPEAPPVRPAPPMKHADPAPAPQAQVTETPAKGLSESFLTAAKLTLAKEPEEPEVTPEWAAEMSFEDEGKSRKAS